MRIHNAIYGALIVAISTLMACRISVQKSYTKGNIAQSEVNHEIPIITSNNLIIVPLEINGKEYNFLFDTGAPTSISFEIQEEFDFKKVSQGTIRDTDRNKRKVNYVRVDQMRMGGLDFENFTAFVADFDANAVLACLDIDGIVGSNMMYKYNWLIDRKEKKMLVTNNALTYNKDEDFIIPFKADQQYNMKIVAKIGRASVTNISVDYGSNGSLTLPTNAYHKVKNAGIIDSAYTLIGSQQSGLFGKALEFKRELGSTDSLLLGDLELPTVGVKQGNSALLGTKILFNYKVGLDWQNRRVILQSYEEQKFSLETFGIIFGKDSEGKLIQLACVENGDAYQKGLRNGYRIIEINDLNTEGESGFCQFIELVNQSPKYLKITYLDSTKQEIEVEIDKFNYKP